jgi:hypothetical protein
MEMRKKFAVKKTGQKISSRKKGSPVRRPRVKHTEREPISYTLEQHPEL